jgi:hypothetical protein
MHYRSFHRDHDSHPLPAIPRIYSTSRQPVAIEIGNDIPIIGIMRRRANAFQPKDGMEMADLNSLVIFAKVVEAKGFSEAARCLKIPISTVIRGQHRAQNQG